MFGTTERKILREALKFYSFGTTLKIARLLRSSIKLRNKIKEIRCQD